MHKYAIAALLLLAIIWVFWPLVARAQQNLVVQYIATTTTLTKPPMGWQEMMAGAPKTVESMVRAAFPDAPIMVKIAQAESQFSPEAKNPHSSATGVFQILLSTWNAYQCGGSRTNAADNIACARKLYDDSGTTPWNASKPMWGQFIDNSLTKVNNG